MIRAVVSFCSLAAVALSKPVYTLKDAPVTGGLCDPNVKSLSGYINVYDSEIDAKDKNYFFWFFESRSNPSTDPMAMWLTGGPGCSSQLALMTENGPCVATPDGLDTENNPYSWNSNSNIMWIDQPSGVGYSYGSKDDHNQTMVAEDLYHFLQGFFEAHPEYQTNPFFVFGESYGGHYVPAISNRIYKGNQNNDGLHINLQGLGIGNGLTDPVVQYQYYPAMAMNNTYDIKCVSEEAYDEMVDHMPTCINMAKLCQVNESACDDANTYCNTFETTPYYNTGLNPYDIRVPCGDNSLCYDFTNVETFLNLASTRDSLHVSDEVKEWTECNTAVNLRFSSDWMRDFQQDLIPLLENDVRVLIYAGDVDFICNWMGNKAWTEALHWTGHSAFNAEADQPWVYGLENVQGGVARTAAAVKGTGSLTFLQVYEAGHMVPMDQPEAALDMYNRFVFNKPFYK